MTPNDSNVLTEYGALAGSQYCHYTIELGNLIVCGLPALPHDLVHKSDARRRLLRVPRYIANQYVAATIP